jgi:hypothetical protein
MANIMLNMPNNMPRIQDPIYSSKVVDLTHLIKRKHLEIFFVRKVNSQALANLPGEEIIC